MKLSGKPLRRCGLSQKNLQPVEDVIVHATNWENKVVGFYFKDGKSQFRISILPKDMPELMKMMLDCVAENASIVDDILARKFGDV